jgi:rhamnogalacturonyl hydrolase YesR
MFTSKTAGLFAVALTAAIALRSEAASAAFPSHETAAQILAETQRVADWQLAHLDTSYVPIKPADDKSQRGWVYGAFFVGLTALAERSPDPKYAEAVFAQGKRQNWGLERRLFHADDYVIGQSWIWAYERAHDPKMIAPIKARLDAIAAAAPKVSLEFGDDPPPGVEHACQLRWCWSDALFMGPPAWAELSRATADPKYLLYADGEYWATVDYLFDKKESLFSRDSRFFARHGPHGERIFWSRGNGWVYAGLARMLQFLPRDYPSRPRYETLFRKMSERLVALQKPDGCWSASLLAPPEGMPPETSGTGFFTFGLAYGVKAGLLPEPRFRAAAMRGWAALKAAVHPDGKLGWVQPIGAAPDAVSADDTQLYGVGAFLLAGSAMFDLAAPAGTQLTIRNPLDLAHVAAEVEIPASLLPRGILSGEWVVAVEGQIAPLQILKRGSAVAVLDLPAHGSVEAVVRRRVPSDPAPDDFVRATIPVKQGDGYRQMPRFVVPKSHVIHDPLFPIEGAGWESDRAGYRVYLDKRNTVDVFGKKLPGAVLHLIGQGRDPYKGSYHDESDWGMDIWHVGDSLGAGSLGVLRGGMATQIGDTRRIVAAVESSGPVVAAMRIESGGWRMGRRPANLIVRYSIASGSRLMMVSASASRGVLLVAGFGKYPNTVFIRSDAATGWGYVATWGQQSENGKDVVGMALFYPVAEVSSATDDGRSYYVRFKNPAKARYAVAAAWVKEGGGITDEAGFRAYLDQTAAELSHPAVVTAGGGQPTAPW